MIKDKKEFIQHLKENKIPFFPSETHYLLLKGGKK